MQDSFDYLCVKESLDSISVEDSGNVCLRANNDFGTTWYLGTTTDMGTVNILQFGPIAAEIGIDIYSKSGFTYNQIKIDYDEKKLHKIIDKFLNDPGRQITQVMELTSDEFYEELGKVIKQL